MTVDKNARFQLNFAKRNVSLVTLNPLLVDYAYIAPLADTLLELLAGGLQPGSVVVITPE